MEGVKFLKIFEQASSFDAALVKVVQIVEQESLKVPLVEVSPRWIYPEDSTDTRPPTLVFDIEVSSNFRRDTGEEILNPMPYMDS